MKALLNQFFNVAIMSAAWPTLMIGLQVTLKICLVVIPLGLAGGLFVALVSMAKQRYRSG